jgi:hypothetical protein
LLSVELSGNFAQEGSLGHARLLEVRVDLAADIVACICFASLACQVDLGGEVD